MQSFILPQLLVRLAIKQYRLVNNYRSTRPNLIECYVVSSFNIVQSSFLPEKYKGILTDLRYAAIQITNAHYKFAY